MSKMPEVRIWIVKESWGPEESRNLAVLSDKHDALNWVEALRTINENSFYSIEEFVVDELPL
jgi:hypothetical protein